ncbi:hypothetical protein FIBSPDRAFT_959149 [Athelia psychrophila]|uniref:DUF6532 domain-containing protein n=1 Tax=Athelia psychrophila TaxID=1759441 RepID=A0A166DXT6_9AGAM|nr:hypothetical protein FIBSPDRAFT_959149 [Fibularhizoctonia sp. CBS 109695]
MPLPYGQIHKYSGNSIVQLHSHILPLMSNAGPPPIAPTARAAPKRRKAKSKPVVDLQSLAVTSEFRPMSNQQTPGPMEQLDDYWSQPEQQWTQPPSFQEYQQRQQHQQIPSRSQSEHQPQQQYTTAPLPSPSEQDHQPQPQPQQQYTAHQPQQQHVVVPLPSHSQWEHQPQQQYTAAPLPSDSQREQQPEQRYAAAPFPSNSQWEHQPQQQHAAAPLPPHSQWEHQPQQQHTAAPLPPHSQWEQQPQQQPFAAPLLPHSRWEHQPQQQHIAAPLPSHSQWDRQPSVEQRAQLPLLPQPDQQHQSSQMTYTLNDPITAIPYTAAPTLLQRSMSYPQPTASTSVPASLRGLSIDALRKRREDELHTLSGSSQSVLGAHRKNRTQRLPQPYALMNRASSPSAASHIRSAMSDSSSIAGSSAASQRDVAGTSQDPPPPHRRTASPSAHGIERQLHPSRRRSNVEPKGPPISLDDKANRDQAGAILIARLCARNCWPLADAERKKDLTESLLQANALATRENRPTTPQSKAMQNRILAMASAWRGTAKVAAFNYMAGWEITPTEHQKDQLKMTRADVIAFTQARVKVLLHRDAFCDEGVNDDGQLSLYNNSAFQTFIIGFFYGHNGIAVKYPEGFKTIFPIAALAFARSVVRVVLDEHKTGQHVTRKLDAPRQLKYKEDLDTARKLINPAVDRYHPKLIQEIRVSIAQRGQ